MKNRPRWCAALALFTLYACAPGSNPEQPGDSPEDGYHRSPVRFRGETEEWVWQDVNGYAVAEGDIVLGRTDALLGPDGQPETIANHTNNLGKLWTSNTIAWRYHQTISGTDDLNADQKTRWLSALAVWERLTPLRFEHDVSKTATKYINVKDKDLGDPDWCRSEIGMPSSGSKTNLWVNDCGVSGIVHEIGHAVGLKHEQSRTDRNSFVTYTKSCVRSGKRGNYGTSGTTPAGPFSFDSIMLYHPYSFVKEDNFELPSPSVDPGTTDLIFDATPFFTRAGEGPAVHQGSAFDRFDFLLRYRRVRSDGSVATVTFSRQNGTTNIMALAMSASIFGMETVDGSLLPAADNPSGFNIALQLNTAATMAALPGETMAQLTNGANWTVVLEFDSPDPSCPAMTRAGLGLDDPGALWTRNTDLHNAGDLSVIWSLYDAGALGAASPGDMYGSSVTTGDFDDDGLVDAAVAVPGADTVALYKGVFDHTRTDGLGRLVPWREMIAFGATTVASGDFNGDGYDDLAIGAPDDGVAQGAVTVLLGSRNGIDQGAVTTGAAVEEYRFGFLPSAFSGGSRKTGPVSETEVPFEPWPSGCALTGAEAAWGAPGDRFGAALHVTDLNNDGLDDLLVGAPGADSALDARDLTTSPASLIPGQRDTGVVVVLTGRSQVKGGAPLAMAHTLSPYTPVDAPPTTGGFTPPAYSGGHVDAEFGTSIATADLDGDGCQDVLVGAPGDVASISGSTPPTVNGTHLLGMPPRPGRVWGFRTHNSDRGCWRVTNKCDEELRLFVDYEEPNGNDGARYGHSVAAAPNMFTSGGLPLAGVVVGAPFSPALLDGSPVGASGRADVYANPAADGGLRFAKTPDRALRQSMSTAGPDGLDESNDQFGFAVAAQGSSIVVGAPGDSHGPGPLMNVGTVYQFAALGSSSVTGGTHVSGMTGLGAAPGARYGAFITFAHWDNNPTATPGPVIAAPGHLNGLGDPVGIVEWQRGVTTAAGAAFATPGDLTELSP